MNRSALLTQAKRLSVLSLGVSAVFALAGCDTLNDWLAPDRVNYKAAETAPALAVPSDLSTADISQRYAAPPKENTLGGTAARSVTPAGNTTLGVPTAQDPYGMHVESDGDRRWLVVDGRVPDQVWPQLQEFWTENGFTLKTDSPQTGIMATDWAENRANIPDDWFRKSVGKLIDFAYSSGTRDMFRTQVDRAADGSTDINVTHSAMEEVLTGQDKTSSRWETRPRNPALEAAILVKIMQKFGLTEDQGKKLVTQARPAGAKVAVDSAAGGSTLDLAEPFDRAWLRVGLALDRTNFTVDNRDRAKGLYYVHYSDSMAELKKEGFFGKLFSSNTPMPTRQFFVNVKPKADALTQIAVVDANGQPDNSSDAQRIVSLLHAQLN
ncbi:outer membrane protein assembly factor BamC [Caballeronia sp. LP006]|jgi:outer membrane protein assembly factor BamC|uniref:outer membrane protein assembly factor BamC n=1 Tax=unclassified Caballeronia TaxID=2646786 RepID=UPI001FD0E80D|nr:MULTISPECIES: outer membrane protein assembly factor BamC [unclassified Caballeronia]MDR5771958.1 outer membrane protein assembly factor BamC [Caballeronia sp. LZ002]MDR5804564.1 outer membrane protein assembly factor BamC [Caballeronia sp. LZ001]MDR5831599.1 outer membrane protein assembly factor BamC [Caballeronia sp. LP006]MDR5847392.1 outer membrane protein assembly factor BamC [Caballeronia sp. LZ003]